MIGTIAAAVLLFQSGLVLATDHDEALGRWAERVTRAVEAHWDKSAIPKGRDCSVRIEQNKKGEVLSATVMTSCGTRESDASMLKAVWKASPLPLPDDPRMFDTEMIITFAGEHGG